MKKRILIVDDDPDMFDVLTDLLMGNDYELVWAHNGISFEKLALEKRPDLIVLDILLGDDNGPSIYGRLLSHGLSREIPVIFLSGLASDLPVSRLHPGRNYSMHSKPFHHDNLLRDIQYLMAA